MKLLQAWPLLAISVSTGWFVVRPLYADVPHGRFINPQQVPGVNSLTSELYPVISVNGLELFFRSDRGGNPDIWVATRPTKDQPFQSASNLGAPVNGSLLDEPGGISSDGLTLYFASGPSGAVINFDMYQATRATLQSPFSNVTSLGPGVNTNVIENQPFISLDGLQLFYHQSAANTVAAQTRVRMATRSSTQDTFADSIDLGDVVNGMDDARKPTVSADGMTMFFSDFAEAGAGPPRPGGLGGSDIWVSHRNSTTEPFGAPVNLNTMWPGSTVNSPLGEGLAYISPDWPAFGSKLYYVSDRSDPIGDIWEATWVPEPSSLAIFAIASVGVLGFMRGRS
jgi:hypothetical protein